MRLPKRRSSRWSQIVCCSRRLVFFVEGESSQCSMSAGATNQMYRADGVSSVSKRSNRCFTKEHINIELAAGDLGI